MTPEIKRQIIAGLCRSMVVYIAARFSIGALDQGHLDQVVAALTVVGLAGYSAFAKWRAGRLATEKIEQLKTVVETKTVEAQVLRAVVAVKEEETGIMVKALNDAAVPIPAIPPKPTSIAQLAADLHNQKMSGLEQLTAEQVKNN
jgi:hypothetical protein